MIFEKLANGITKHAKIVLILWVVLLCASIYPMMHASDSLSYDMESMGGKTTESVDGAIIAGQSFETAADQSSAPMLLITFDKEDASKAAIAAEAATYVSDALEAQEKIKGTMVAPMPSDGLVLILAFYNSLDAEFISDDTGNLRSFFKQQMSAYAESSGNDLSGFKTYVTGSPAVSYDAGEGMSHDLSLVEPISIFLILFLVGLFFRSPVSAGAPPITIGVAYALVMCALFFLGQVIDIFYIVQMLLLTSMLGAGCDYCIFILSRYREERRRGLEHIAASKEAIMWAGESVFTSGMAVMIGFGAMMVCDFQVVSVMGLGLAIGIVFALLAALTLMSSLVVLLGDKLFWPSGASGPKHERGYLKAMGNVAHKYFDISTHFSIKHAKAVIIATILFSVPMVYVYANSETSYDMVGSIMSGESQEGMNVLADSGIAGSSMPNFAIIETDELGTLSATTILSMPMFALEWSPTKDETIASLNAVSDAVMASGDPNINSVDYVVTWEDLGLSDSDTMSSAVAAAMANPKCSVAMIQAISTVKDMLVGTLMESATLGDLDTALGGKLANVMNYVILVKTGHFGTTEAVVDVPEDQGGGTVVVDGSHITYAKISMTTKASVMDNVSIDTVNSFSHLVHSQVSSLPHLNKVMISGTAAVMVEISNEMSTQFLKIELTALILIIILLFFVMKSYLTPIRSVVTIFMSVIWTVAITQLLYTDLLNEGVLWLLPIILLVICLGLGMDYDILLTTRIREYRFDKGMSNDEAIHQAVLHSGSVITICGVIMAFTFGTLMLSNTLLLQQMGFALWFAILVDALIVRTYIVPAAMHLMGEWNWKGPAFLHPKRLPTTHEAASAVEHMEVHEYDAEGHLKE